MKGMCCRMVAVQLFVLVLIISVGPVAASQVNAASNYEIPLVELQKVKKERPAKRDSRERKRKKSDVAPEQKTYGVTVQPETPAAPKNEGESKPVTAATPVESPLSIHHEPYSYLLTGKRTIIQSIISGTNSIASVYCRFRSAETAGFARVQMSTVPGTFFTYSATLPGLAPASKELRYSIIAIDTAGNEIKSPEYVTAVKASSVVPGWQLESAQEPLKVLLEDKEKPLEGFSDPNLTQ